MARTPDLARRAELARAAFEVLRTRGVQTSMRELADALGVKRPTLYFYFPDLGAVFESVLDETYRDMTHGEPLPAVASLSPRAISVCSMSKAFGLPGIRIGWAVTRDAELAEKLLAAKEQIVICGSGLDEAVAAQALAESERILPPILAKIERHREIVSEWIDREPLVDWVAPAGGAVCFPRLADGVDPDAFYRHLNEVGATFVGEGHWFDEDRRFFRLGFGWPGTEELREGLAAISAAASVGGEER